MDHDQEDVRQGRISELIFSFPTSERIYDSSVVSLTKSTSKTRKQLTLKGTDDPSLGTNNRNIACQTCGEKPRKCIGHFGHISLGVPCFHPDKNRVLKWIFQIFCF